jgi:hypothetical protein
MAAAGEGQGLGLAGWDPETFLNQVDANPTQLVAGEAAVPGQVGADDQDNKGAVVLACDATDICRGEKIAISNFAKYHGLEEASVSKAMVESSSEGIFHWATRGGEWGSRQAAGQAFVRALKHSEAGQNIYKYLDDVLALEFRQKWSMSHNFSFVKEERVITSSYRKDEIQSGRMVTKAQLAVALGINAYAPETPEYKAVVEQVDLYFSNAIRVGGRFHDYNQWINADTVLQVDKLLTVSCSKTWSMIASQSETVNKWEERARECKARRSYATAKGLCLDAVSLADVAASPEGITGWADTAISVGVSSRCGAPSGRGSPGTKTGSKAKAKPKAADGTKSMAQYEKELKNLISVEMSLTEAAKNFKEKLGSVSDETDDAAWADTYLKQIAASKDKVVSFREGCEFLRQFEKCCLSTEALKKFRKDCGNEYQAKLIRSIDGLEDPISDGSKVLDKLQSMALAAHPETFQTPKKTKQGSKRKSASS